MGGQGDRQIYKENICVGNRSLEGDLDTCTDGLVRILTEVCWKDWGTKRGRMDDG